jgi:RND superfamily putative drug exporter
METLRWIISRHPRWVVALWLMLAAVMGSLELFGPLNLSRLTAEGQAQLLPKDIESGWAADVIRRTWPEQAFDSVAVGVYQRAGGVTEGDRAYLAELARSIMNDPKRPAPILRVLGPESTPEIARFLTSGDRTTTLLVAQLSSSFVAPATHDAVAWLERKASARPAPDGLTHVWSGDAVLGRDYLGDVQRSLDRAALATVVLLLIVLLVVYRSFVLALVPLVTIGVGLIISRGVLASLALGGWAMSPLVELFLVVILFGCGTDFCLFISWRYGEHWNPSNPAAALRTTLKRAIAPLLTSAGTVIAGLSLMGLTRFRLFNSTGPSVALGLALTVVATLTLTPALLLLVARYRPQAFAGLTAPSSGFWDRVGRAVLSRPLTIWLSTVIGMAAVAAIGFQVTYLQDLVAELPQDTPAVRGMSTIADKFGAGRVAPMTVLVKWKGNLRSSEGLALLDDMSRLLAHQRRLLEVRSATQPLGSTAPLEPARLDARLEAIDDGFRRMAEGATALQDGLTQGAAKLRTAIQVEELTGIPLTGPTGGTPSRESLVSGLKQATGAMFGIPVESPKEKTATAKANPTRPDAPEPDKKPADPRAQMLEELTLAADGARQIAEGSRRARTEMREILTDPVGKKSLSRLLITPRNVAENQDLARALDTYIADDGHTARIDLVQADRLFSPEALDQVDQLRRQLREWLAEVPDHPPEGRPAMAITGPNAVSADTRSLTQSDQVLSWIIVPTGVFLILLITLRDPLACLNLVVTMVLTYLFALGVTHLIFVTWLGAEGLDWKVAYFLFVLLVAVGVDYNVFLMTRLHEEAEALGLRAGTIRAIAQTGGLISSAAAITACSFAALIISPLSSLRQLGVALVVGIAIDATLVRPILVPCGQWLMGRGRERRRRAAGKVGPGGPNASGRDPRASRPLLRILD